LSEVCALRGRCKTNYKKDAIYVPFHYEFSPKALSKRIPEDLRRHAAVHVGYEMILAIEYQRLISEPVTLV
jgi:hypothetical protein